jgi:hypothetical protein
MQFLVSVLRVYSIHPLQMIGRHEGMMSLPIIGQHRELHKGVQLLLVQLHFWKAHMPGDQLAGGDAQIDTHSLFPGLKDK